MARSIWMNSLACGIVGAITALTAQGLSAQDDVLIQKAPLDLIANTDKEVVVVLDDETAPAEAPQSQYWLGVQLAALPEVAKHQLGVEHGLTVEDVMPDSPAAKAEIKKFDILLKAGDTPLKEAADLIKSVDASQGKEITITVIRGGKDRTVRVVATRRPEKERMDVRVPRPELGAEIKRLEEALQSLKSKAGKEGLGLWFARPAVVAPRVDYKIASPKEIGEFPKDLSVQINKQGDQPTKVHVKSGDKEWNITEDKQGISLRELPDDIRPHVLRVLLGAPTSGRATDTRVLRVTREGKVEGELRIAPVPPVPPVAPKPPAPPAAPALPAIPAAPYRSGVLPSPQAARTFYYRAERAEDSDESKLDTIIKKLDQLESGALGKLDKEVKQLRKELDELRSKSPGDARK
jgi:hypothetical protein